LLLQKVCLNCGSFDDDLHVGFRQVPAFASHMIKKG